ncbi:MAG: hypothetical protein H6Q72_4209 [Firmicutes bacterium]|nr:hypothetical protein [Bacillota bacterium]
MAKNGLRKDRSEKRKLDVKELPKETVIFEFNGLLWIKSGRILYIYS